VRKRRQPPTQNNGFVAGVEVIYERGAVEKFSGITSWCMN